MQHVSDLHPKFALCHTMCGSMVDSQCPTVEIRRGNKKRKKKPQHENIYVRILLRRAAINEAHVAAAELPQLLSLNNKDLLNIDV